MDADQNGYLCLLASLSRLLISTISSKICLRKQSGSLHRHKVYFGAGAFVCFFMCACANIADPAPDEDVVIVSQYSYSDMMYIDIIDGYY
jgi:hypothetical protein